MANKILSFLSLWFLPNLANRWYMSKAPTIRRDFNRFLSHRPSSIAFRCAAATFPYNFWTSSLDSCTSITRRRREGGTSQRITLTGSASGNQQRSEANRTNHLLVSVGCGAVLLLVLLLLPACLCLGILYPLYVVYLPTFRQIKKKPKTDIWRRREFCSPTHSLFKHRPPEDAGFSTPYLSVHIEVEEASVINLKCAMFWKMNFSFPTPTPPALLRYIWHEEYQKKKKRKAFVADDGGGAIKR